MASKPRSVNEWIKRYLKEEKPRSKSLIVTIFGDALVPNVSGVWLSELIELLQPFAVNERLARTSCFRLIEEGWLESARDGRRSRYALTPSGIRRFEHAYRRIYNPPQSGWNRKWTLVVFPRSGSALDRNGLRNELAWEGFASLAPGVFVHPSADTQSLAEILEQLEPQQRPIVLDAADAPDLGARAVSELTGECWNLSEISDTYRGFIDFFEPAVSLASEGMSPENAFVLQTLLMHSFRRASLHDPRLPGDLLGADWPGHAAYDLCRRLYRLTYRDTHRFLKAKLSEPIGQGVPDSVLQRFDGLSS
ncbi:phenylacetic acid degradation operon negative regulatory protein PaaX [Solimonas soli]|uniref:phenylacetic acid degradation operon negative regulatory protein PaaX n=1 Tax=Solimonas soli TaxID=413479 RepID=UPI0004802092|nr:phenylacetic acid degradation operon negative regulatory protein PaaX [Solimonas soli]